jgi:hypothetical protein
VVLYDKDFEQLVSSDVDAEEASLRAGINRNYLRAMHLLALLQMALEHGTAGCNQIFRVRQSRSRLLSTPWLLPHLSFGANQRLARTQRSAYKRASSVPTTGRRSHSHLTIRCPSFLALLINQTWFAMEVLCRENTPLITEAFRWRCKWSS